MNTIVELKKALKIGTKWSAVHYDRDGNILKDFGVRIVANRTTTKVGFLTVIHNQEEVSWLNIPKKSEIIHFFEDGFVCDMYGVKTAVYREVTE